MLSLTSTPLDKIKYKGKIYRINLAFDRVLKFSYAQDDKELNSEDVIDIGIKLFFGNQKLPRDEEFYTAAFQAINKEITERPYGNWVDPDDVGYTPQDSKPLLDYRRDAEAIYSSFMQQYHIDLIKEQGKMHWCIFKALFDGLDERTYIQKIIAIRDKEVDPKDSAEIQNDLINKKHYFAISNPFSEKEKAKVFNSNALSSFFGIPQLKKAKEGGNSKG